MTLKKFILALAIFNITIGNSQTDSLQEDFVSKLYDSNDFKNAILVNPGYFFIVISLNGYYERHLISTNNLKHHFSLKMGYSITGYESIDELQIVSVQATYLTGANRNHFELSAGAGVDISHENFFTTKPKIIPAFNIGYRYQIPTKRFFFRTGIGMSDWIYVGAGFRF